MNLLTTAALIWIVSGQLVPSPKEGDALKPSETTIVYDATANEGLNYTLAYNLTDNGQSVQFQVQMKVRHGDLAAFPWMGIGFGRSMIDSNTLFVGCRAMESNPQAMQNKAYVFAAVSSGKYGPPSWVDLKDVGGVPISGAYDAVNGVFRCRLKLPLVTPYITFDPSVATTIMWAFNPTPIVNSNGDIFSTHGPMHKGVLSVVLKGDNTETVALSAVSYEGKQVHGFGMMAVWLLLFPFGIYYAKFFKATRGWAYVKASIQTAGVIGLISFFGVILKNTNYPSRPHSILGFVIVSLVFVQLTFGITNLLSISSHKVEKYKSLSRLVHMVLGYSLIIAALVQIYLGLDVLYPYAERDLRGRELWVLFIVVVLFWILLFLCTSLYFVYLDRSAHHLGDPKAQSNVLRGTAMTFKPMMAVSGFMGKTTVKKEGDKQPSRSTLMNRYSMALDQAGIMKNPQAIQQFTWESIDQAVLSSGKMLVVGNGRYVYDISKWITSHPGGQLILHAVNGTDITNDYFNESGFDADEFTHLPNSVVAPPELNRTTISRNLDTVSTHSAVAITPANDLELADDLQDDPSPISEADWKCLVRARRTHVHTRMAIQKLSSMLVGEIVSYQGATQRFASSATLNEEEDDEMSMKRMFDPCEYRRYAMTLKELVTSDKSSTPVYKVRFCLLYPYDKRHDSPRGFMPGEHIQLQMRIQGEIVSRFYTPMVGGDLSCFECFVQLNPEGVLTPFLLKQRCGDRQVKIRGPFGSPLLRVERPISVHMSLSALQKQHMSSLTSVPERLIFIAGGKGIVPLLQLLNYVFLPKHVAVSCIADYTPNFDDELKLGVGDVVVAKHHYNDGWCFGTNKTTMLDGIFPLSCTAPRHFNTQNAKIVLINCVHSLDDVIGREILEGANLAFPFHFDAYHFVENRGDLEGYQLNSSVQAVEVQGVVGKVINGVATERKLMQVVAPLWEQASNSGNESSGASQMCFVSGMDGRFSNRFMDAMVEFGADSSQLNVLMNHGE